MPSIHFKCERQGPSFRGLTVTERTTRIYRSCCWDLSEDDAIKLSGGWIYLHSTKASPSQFGGEIIGYEEVLVEEFSKPRRIALFFKARMEGKGQPWRGQAHGMAWTSGIVDSDCGHEIRNE